MVVWNHISTGYCCLYLDLNCSSFTVEDASFACPLSIQYPNSVPFATQQRASPKTFASLHCNYTQNKKTVITSEKLRLRLQSTQFERNLQSTLFDRFDVMQWNTHRVSDIVDSLEMRAILYQWRHASVLHWLWLWHTFANFLSIVFAASLINEENVFFFCACIVDAQTMQMNEWVNMIFIGNECATQITLCSMSLVEVCKQSPSFTMNR